MKKQKPNKQCESCRKYGKGTCNAFKCIARNYCDWEDIVKQDNASNKTNDSQVINDNLGLKSKVMENINESNKPNNSNEHTEDKSEMSYNSNDWRDRLDNLKKEAEQHSIKNGFAWNQCIHWIMVEDFISSELQREREKVLEEVREIIGDDEEQETYYEEDISRESRNEFRHELLSKIKELKKK